ncbi:hypothetical protein RF11_08009 [Thelohanellus kitauei]|uniref:Uncharacterized protein n=1 Tax=Thelohanellus kitauei TaxID=669202 RepID=A0A0C2MMM4_THEKT|nr:hypothetical protein RF11_08009 [Thelohanellus kitauei]
MNSTIIDSDLYSVEQKEYNLQYIDVVWNQSQTKHSITIKFDHPTDPTFRFPHFVLAGNQVTDPKLIYHSRKIVTPVHDEPKQISDDSSGQEFNAPHPEPLLFKNESLSKTYILTDSKRVYII